MVTTGTRTRARTWTKLIGAGTAIALSTALPAMPAGAAVGPDQVLEPAGEATTTFCPPGCLSGQTFVPAASTIDAVDLALTSSSGGQGSSLVTIEIRETDASGAVVGQISSFRGFDDTMPADSWQQFVFDTPIAVTPGQTYFLRFSSNGGVVPHGTATSLDRYADGTRYIYDSPAGGDLYFRTHGELDTSSGADADGDGVDDADDLCADTDMGASTPASWNKNRFWNDATGAFVDGRGNPSGLTLADTGGCDGHQIVEGAELGKGHTKHGLSKGELTAWAGHAALR